MSLLRLPWRRQSAAGAPRPPEGARPTLVDVAAEDSALADALPHLEESSAHPAPRSLFGEILDWMLAPLLLLWPSLAICAKRWHDVDKSAWWILIALVPVVGGLIALVFNGFIPGTPGPNRFGNPPGRTLAAASRVDAASLTPTSPSA